MTKVNEKVQKLFNISLKSLDEEKRQATFVFSDDSIDRYGEKVDQSWDTKNYEKNPIILWGHDPSKAENVIGSSVDLTLNDGGKSLMTAQFDDDPHAELIWNKVKKGILRTVSAGFIPHSIEYENDVPVLKDNELLEISVVAIPANPNAVALDYKAGEMSRKDADFLIKSMRDEADAIEAVTRAADEEQDQAARIAELEQQLADAQKRAEDAEAALAAKETEDEEGEEEDDSAKGGDHDQSGAETDIDLDAELSEEDFEALEVPDDEEQK